MAVQVETKGQLQEFLEILKKRKWQVLLPALVIISLGVAAAVIVPKKYVARTQVEVRPVNVSIGTRDTTNAIFQIPALNRIQKVLKERQDAEYLSLSPEEQREFVARVKSNIKVTTAASTKEGATFVNIDYMDVEKERAVDFLRALRDDWTDDVLSRDINNARALAQQLREARNKTDKQLRDEKDKLAELKRSNNLSVTQVASRSDNLRPEDPDFLRLTQNQEQLEAVQRELATLETKQEELQRQYDEMPPKLTREDLVTGQTNEAELNDVERQIQQLTEELKGIKPKHSDFQKKSTQIDALRERRDQLQRLVTKGGIETTTVENPDRAPKLREIEAVKLEIAQKRAAVTAIKRAIADGEVRVEQLRQVYRQVSDREERIARLTEALDKDDQEQRKAERTYAQLNSAEANPFEITADVAGDRKPTEPNPWLIVSFGLVFGLAVGIGTAVVSEYSRNCFRSVADISRVMVVPVLGAINHIQTRRERRTRTARRTVVGVSSLILIGTILFVTWAWANDAQLLSQDLRDAIERVRSKLK